MPLLFHPADPKTLLFATNVLWKTTTGGYSWEIISRDLSRERPDVPESIGVSDASLACYRAYLELQDVRDAIDARPADERAKLMTLRGAGEPGDQDVLYGSITAVAPERETVVGLQQKFLYILTLLQGADRAPTPQALGAITELQKTLAAVKACWSAAR